MKLRLTQPSLFLAGARAELGKSLKFGETKKERKKLIKKNGKLSILRIFKCSAPHWVSLVSAYINIGAILHFFRIIMVKTDYAFCEYLYCLIYIKI